MIFNVLATLGLVQLVAAQYGAPPTSGTTSAAASAPSIPPNSPGQWNVEVAPGEKFVFSQTNITAKIGDNVTWWFPNNGLTHSVTQSNFQNPCTHLAASGNSSAGFDSGLTAGTTFTITITGNQTIWYHCKQSAPQGHCGLGMVGSINAPSDGNTYDKFLAAAMQIGSSEAHEADSGTPVLTGVGAVATAGPMTPSATAGGSKSGAVKSVTNAGWYLGTALVVVSML